MASAREGDTRQRRRVTTIIKPEGVSAVGAYSSQNQDGRFCDKHFIHVVYIGAVTGGILSVRARPVNANPGITGGVAKATLIGIEGADLSKINSTSWEVSGFFDAFELSITNTITGGGSIAVVINSIETT
jgi:hypothetical protein